MKKLSKNIASNMEYLTKILHVDQNFDLASRIINLNGHQTAIYTIDSFVK